ncbi:hypothetical protein HII28_08645 [Planctomonas sp. JC2975]|uniref:hypothetical protein n=1 Tax=Planctomonas sp. JC2975 TaxID=2729626 RepID=UPI00147389F1|nr:hypothetical protein [Planctomonas sp. JC2975]NNC11947.1 hypothetical protein [Planctomonas sp. JC2975]
MIDDGRPDDHGAANGATRAPWEGTDAGVGATGPTSAAQKPRRRGVGLLIGLILGGLALLAATVLGAVWFASEAVSHTPQAAAVPYLTALAKGDVKKAVALGRIDTHSPLVTDAAYAKTQDRITGYSIAKASIGDSAASVQVTYTQDGDRHTDTLLLTKSGTDLLFFPRWTLKPITLPHITVSVGAPDGAALQVNGTAITGAGERSTNLDVLPGTYNVRLADNPAYQAVSKQLPVTALNGEAAGTPVGTASLAAMLTDAGIASASTAVNAWVAACIAQQTIQPDGCSFGLIDDYPDVTLTNQHWTLVDAPSFDVGDWDGTGWTVTTTAAGSATFSADAATSDGRHGTLTSQDPVAVQVAGHITGFDANGKAIFVSIDWSGKETLPTA